MCVCVWGGGGGGHECGCWCVCVGVGVGVGGCLYKCVYKYIHAYTYLYPSYQEKLVFAMLGWILSEEIFFWCGPSIHGSIM